MAEHIDFRKRRSHFHLIGEILDVASEGASKTRIMYRANLSASMTKEYIQLLEQLSLVEVLKEDGRVTYRTNQKGFQYLQNYKQILQMLNGNGSSPSIKGGPVTYWIEKTSPETF
ncbi:hypothetical protein KEJ15_06190 [Candidatus Bathyarchaeota archaeon]|nr:hypothetical protein [Candidatus Bathyarchaeota archaeon]